MSAIEIRPRFKEVVPIRTEDVLERLNQALNDPETKITGSIFDHHVRLKIPIEDQHYWSPQLSLTLEEDGDSTLMRGLFGPRSSVWLMFVFFYSTIGAICLFVSITGFSQLSLGIPAPVLWVLPIGAVLALSLYLMAKAGERLGKDEMRLLKNFLDSALVTSDRHQQTDNDGKTILNTGT